jgi:hypothetical protein
MAIVQLLRMQISFTARRTNAVEFLPFPGRGILFKDILWNSLGKASAYRKASACAEQAQRKTPTHISVRSGI